MFFLLSPSMVTMMLSETQILGCGKPGGGRQCVGVLKVGGVVESSMLQPFVTGENCITMTSSATAFI